MGGRLFSVIVNTVQKRYTSFEPGGKAARL